MTPTPIISIITPTHNPVFLKETWQSIKRQTYKDWEWVIVPNGKATVGLEDFDADLREKIRIIPYTGFCTNIGAIKNFAFSQGRGEWLLELDHDDLLVPTTLEELVKATEEEVDFVYSDCADWSPAGIPMTYHDSTVRRAWEQNGWTFRSSIINGVKFVAPVSWEPTALVLSHIHFAPNHFRAWRRDFYQRIGGHNAGYAIVDDAELLIRTYLSGNMKLVPKVLYLYRIATNTWNTRVEEIRARSFELQGQHLHSLVLRECQLDGWPAIDLGGAFNCPEGWTSCDREGAKIKADLTERWPFEDGSVGAFRAFDIFEHLPDKIHTMSEVSRCLRSGGYLLSQTPDALGDGGCSDPTHVSSWVPRSFRYYTDRNLAQYIKNISERFMEVRLFRTGGELSYVIADLVSLRGNPIVPGIKNI